MNPNSNIEVTNAGHLHHSTGAQGQTMEIRGLTNANLPTVAQIATHIPDFAWYKPKTVNTTTTTSTASVTGLNTGRGIAQVAPTSTFASTSIGSAAINSPIMTAPRDIETGLAETGITNDIALQNTTEDTYIDIEQQRQAQLDEIKEELTELAEQLQDVAEVINNQLESTISEINREVDLALEQTDFELDNGLLYDVWDFEELARAEKLEDGPNELVLEKFRSLIHPHILGRSRPSVNTWDLEEIARSEKIADGPSDGLFLFRSITKPSFTERESSSSSSVDTWELEEIAREERIAAGPNPVLLGHYHKLVHPYILARYSLLTSASFTASAAAESVLEVVGKGFDATKGAAISAELAGEKAFNRLSNKAANLADRAAVRAEIVSDAALDFGVDAAWAAKDLADRAVVRAEIVGDAAMELAHDAVAKTIEVAPVVAHQAEIVGEKAASLAASAYKSAKQTINEVTPIIAEKAASAYTNAVVSLNEITAEHPIHSSVHAQSPVFDSNELVSFHWPRAVPAWVRDLEELERADRMLAGVDAVLAGKVSRLIHPYIEARVGLAVNSMVTGAKHLAENAFERTREFVHNHSFLSTSSAPVQAVVYRFEGTPSSIGLEYRGDLVDLTFPRRSSLYINNLEEEERASRLRFGVDAILIGKHHRFITQPMLGIKLPAHFTIEAPSVVSRATSSVGSFMGSLLGGAKHLVHDITEVAKHNLPGSASSVETGSLAYITKEEEKERVRRLAEKHDPMVEARKRRVESELLSAIKPAC